MKKGHSRCTVILAPHEAGKRLYSGQRTQINTMKHTLRIAACTAALALAGSAQGQTAATLTSLGASAPTPGSTDISQFNEEGNVNKPDGLNYYTDNGVNNPTVGEPGQTFKTGNSSLGYVLTSVSLKTAGLASFGGIDTAQTYLLHLYSVSNTTATLLTTYNADNFTFEDGDWLQWSGLAQKLDPSTTYAYSCGRTSSGTGWEDFAVASDNVYADGEIAMIPVAGGTVTTGSSHAFDAVFSLGLSVASVPVVSAPTFSPASTVYAGTPVTLTASVVGSAPLHYQWRVDGSNVANSDANPYVLDTTSLSAGTHTIDMIASNGSGSGTSSQVTLTVNAASVPVFNSGVLPATAAMYAKGKITFTAPVEGTLPITYQWKKAGADIAGATNATLTLTNLQATDAGSYTLQAVNKVGTTTASAGVLSVTAPAVGSYAECVVTNGALAYWRLNEKHSNTNAVDSVSGLFGTYLSAAEWGSDSPSGAVAGPVASEFPGFESGNTALMPANAVELSWASVPTPAVKTNTVTIAAWIYPTLDPEIDYTGIFMNRDGVAAGIGYTSGGQIGYTWNSDSTWSWQSGLVPPANAWSFVAVVIQPDRATMYLGTDGKLSNAANIVAHISETWGGRATIGTDQNGSGRAFSGMVDEVAFFDQSLTIDQISALYNTALGKAVQLTAPAIAQEPTSQTLYAGRTAQFKAAATGSEPMTYQWMKGSAKVVDSARISGATNSTLTIAGVTADDAGNYTLVATNPKSSATSKAAVLTVVTPAAGYEKAVVSARPVAYWRFNEKQDASAGGVLAADYYGGFAGTYGANTQNGYNSIAGVRPADGYSIFETGNSAMQSMAGDAGSYVTIPALNLNTNTATFTAWVKPSGAQSDWTGIIMTRQTTQAGLGYTVSQKLGYTWNNNSTWNYQDGPEIPSDQWSFVAVSIHADKAILYVYYGNTYLTTTNVIDHTVEAWGGTASIGADYTDGTRNFEGAIDEAAVFNYALSSEQIMNLYQGVAQATLEQSKLSISSVSGGNVTVSWDKSGKLQSTTALNGSQTTWTDEGTTSPVSVTVGSGAKFFRVLAQ